MLFWEATIGVCAVIGIIISLARFSGAVGSLITKVDLMSAKIDSAAGKNDNHEVRLHEIELKQTNFNDRLLVLEGGRPNVKSTKH